MRTDQRFAILLMAPLVVVALGCPARSEAASTPRGSAVHSGHRNPEVPATPPARLDILQLASLAFHSEPARQLGRQRFG